MGFIMIPDWAARGVLHPREFAVYAALLSRADARTGECFPSYDTLASESGVTRRQVPYALAELTDEGLVRTQRSRSVNRYTVRRFADERPSDYRSRFERGERLAERSRVRQPHSPDDEQHDTVREPHSAECAIHPPQSARDALEPYPVEPDPDELSRVHRVATHDEADDLVDVSAIDIGGTPSTGVIASGRTSKQVSFLSDLHILAKGWVPGTQWVDWASNLTNDEFTVIKNGYLHDLDRRGRGDAADWPEPGDGVFEHLSERGQQWADVGCLPAEMSP